MAERVAYWLALLTVVSVPPAISIWFLIHPFARLWRRVGPGVAYAIITPLMFAFGFFIYTARATILTVNFSPSIILYIVSAPFFAIGSWLGLQRYRALPTSTMLGIPEISRAGRSDRLLTEGIYSRIRHPRYLEIGFMLAGISLVANYLATYVLVVLYIPVVHIIVHLEEKELRERFGEEYERYACRVPRFVPNTRDTSDRQDK